MLFDSETGERIGVELNILGDQSFQSIFILGRVEAQGEMLIRLVYEEYSGHLSSMNGSKTSSVSEVLKLRYWLMQRLEGILQRGEDRIWQARLDMEKAMETSSAVELKIAASNSSPPNPWLQRQFNWLTEMVIGPLTNTKHPLPWQSDLRLLLQKSLPPSTEARFIENLRKTHECISAIQEMQKALIFLHSRVSALLSLLEETKSRIAEMNADDTEFEDILVEINNILPTFVEQE